MPKACFPEAFSCESSMRMNAILKTKLREFARDIHALIDKVGPEDDAAVKALIKDQMKTIFRIISICLGTPPHKFTWEYTDKSKKYHKVEDVSPLDFYNNHVRSSFDVSEKVMDNQSSQGIPVGMFNFFFVHPKSQAPSPEVLKDFVLSNSI